jgi:WD40 repeat protein
MTAQQRESVIVGYALDGSTKVTLEGVEISILTGGAPPRAVTKTNGGFRVELPAQAPSRVTLSYRASKKGYERFDGTLTVQGAVTFLDDGIVLRPVAGSGKPDSVKELAPTGPSMLDALAALNRSRRAEDFDSVQSLIYAVEAGKIAVAQDPNNADVENGLRRALNLAIPKKAFRTASSLTMAKLSSDNSKLLTVTAAGSLQVWDMQSQKSVLMSADDGQIAEASFSNDSAYVLECGSNGTASLRRSDGTAPPMKFADHAGRIDRCALNKDGTQLITAGKDGVARLWNTSDGKLLLKLNHGGALSVARFNHNGSRVMVGSSDKRVTFWDSRSGDLISTTTVPFTPLLAEFSADDSRYFVGGLSGSILLRNSDSHVDMMQPMSVGLPPNGITLEDDNRHLFITINGGKPEYWQFGPGSLLSVRQLPGVPNGIWKSALLKTKDDEIFAVGNHSGRVIFWDVRNNRAVADFRAHTAPIVGMAFTSTGDLLTAGSDGTIKLWNFELPADIQFQRALGSFEFAAKLGKDLIAVSDRKHVINIIDDRTGNSKLVCSGLTSRPIALEADHQNGVLIGIEANALRAWSLSNGQMLWSKPGSFRSLAVSPIGSRLAVKDGTTLRILMTVSGGEVFSAQPSLNYFGSSGRISFGADGAKIAISGGREGAILDASNGSVLFPLPRTNEKWAMGEIRFDRSGRKIAVTQPGASETRLWDYFTGEGLLTLDSDGLGIAFSRDDQKLLLQKIVNEQAATSLWDVDTGRSIELKGSLGATVGSFSLGDDRVVASFDDGLLEIWDAKTGEPVYSWPPWENRKWPLSYYSEDGKRIVTLDNAGQLIIYPATIAGLLELANSTLSAALAEVAKN